ncbi:MAG TPA: serine/threonine-protein kinase, partial [Rhodoglobus sp.]|nr:serine/threonine-protein kinase [Rhodoglobus sp.]
MTMSGTDRAPLELGGTHYAGRYELQSLIGTGGMSAVYRARDTALGRDVAIKILTDGLADAAAAARRQGEVNLLASFAHPSLVTLYDYVTPEGQPSGLVMQLVRGRDLHERLRAGTLDSSTAASIGRQIADALAYLATAGVIHRDVKPGNILVEDHADGRVRALLADFGIARMADAARHTTVGTVIGTARYLSPEQAAGGTVGPPSDVYSLGLVLLEALTGAPAYPGTQVETVAARLTRDPHIPASIDGEWRALLRGMTRREAALRLSAAEAAARLRAIESGAPSTLPLSAAEDEATAAIELPVTATAPAVAASERPRRPAGWIAA